MSNQSEPSIPSKKTMGTFEETARSHVQQSLSSTPAQRLAWLEEALKLAYQAGALPLKNHKDHFVPNKAEAK